jgi:hypothetical protein
MEKSALSMDNPASSPPDEIYRSSIRLSKSRSVQSFAAAGRTIARIDLLSLA